MFFKFICVYPRSSAVENLMKSSPRYAFVDALRGIASVGILLAHLPAHELSGKIPFSASIREFCFRGNFGVQVFFVISGFVIALSLSQQALTWPRALNFVLRRQLRLDPPYLVALGLAVALHGALGLGWPSLHTVALNLVYLHNLWAVPQLLGVAWTLCLEIQFYSAFLLLLALDRWLSRPGPQPFSMLAVHVLWVSALISAFLVQLGTPPQLYALGPYSWFYFAAGALCFWCWRGWAPLWTLSIVILGLTASALWSFTREASFVSASFEGIESGVVTTLLLFVAASRGKLETLSLGRTGQFLGRISYSLYLTHALSVEAVLWTTRHLWGETRGVMSGFFLAVPLAIAVAAGFYRAVELPSVRFAARFKN